MKKTILFMLLLSLSLNAASTDKQLVKELEKASGGYYRSTVVETHQISHYIAISSHTDFNSAQKMVSKMLKNTGYSVVKKWSSHASGSEVIHISDHDGKVYLIAYIRDQFGNVYLTVILNNETYETNT